ncbi:hypothetical protein SFUMM280S_06835 [Streptomyces fumanus]
MRPPLTRPAQRTGGTARGPALWKTSSPRASPPQALGRLQVSPGTRPVLAPAGGAWLWALLLGVSNCAFPLALTMVGMRARTGSGVAQLSAFAQSTGYLISIPGPLLVGVLYQHSGGWGLPIALMAALMVPQMLVGVLAGRDRTVEDEAAAR